MNLHTHTHIYTFYLKEINSNYGKSKWNGLSHLIQKFLFKKKVYVINVHGQMKYKCKDSHIMGYKIRT